MKKIVPFLFTLAFTSTVLASGGVNEEAVQHLEVADVTSSEDARNIFITKTSEMKNREKLDAAELHQIHIITYSLEKSAAYFAESLTKERQVLAKKIAEVVEDIHINSENNRREKTRQHLANYFKLADEFISGF